MIETLARSSLGRTAAFTVGDMKVLTPSIAFVASRPLPEGADVISDPSKGLQLRQVGGTLLLDLGERYCAPVRFEEPEPDDDTCGSALAEPIGEKCAIEPEASDAELQVLEGAFGLRRDARAFVREIASVRKRIGPKPLLFAPGVMDVSNLALLVYCGVDAMDSSLIDYLSSQGRLSTTEGQIKAEDADWVVSTGSVEDFTKSNRAAGLRELGLVRHMTSIGRLRELVEIRSHATPWGVAVLRLLDLEEQVLQERFTAVVGPRFYANSKQSLSRPDIVRYRERIKQRFRPAPHKKILLLIPCSAKKPYFTSKSHRVFRSALMSVPNHEVVQELIVTSPLGVVPRELELFYPAAQYDIPVTGHWDREEVAMVRELVSHVASRGFERVVSHMGPESELLEGVDCIQTSEGRATSSASIQRLISTLTDLCSNYQKVGGGRDRTESVASAARFQFGEGGEALVEGCSVSGLYPISKISHQGTQLCMISQERGMISLTLEGGMRLLKQRMHVVEMEDFELRGNLFCKGVKEADPGLRAGDEALVVRNGELQAVGVAAVSGPEMTAYDRGIAVT
ncbi:MAG TPA: DUF5591 domain-containing protein, partial [Methanomassiliicoccales archaeon]|nr:DUF5591 domain-containing protein [Methanomassiliicoccales archaeon]